MDGFEKTSEAQNGAFAKFGEYVLGADTAKMLWEIGEDKRRMSKEINDEG